MSSYLQDLFSCVCEIFPVSPGLRKHGKDWAAVATVVSSKTDVQCKNFYFNYKKKLNLDALLEEEEEVRKI